MPESLQEFCSSRGIALRIDRDAGLLRGVKLLGLSSKNGREYPDATLARAASLYDGAKVNVNHPKGHPLAPRDYQDRLGTIRNVIARPGEGLFGDLQYNPKHALAEQLLWDAEHAPENVGFSHNVQARTTKRGDQTIVEEILAVQSVDLVADPATTRGLFESEADAAVGWAEQSEAHAHGPSQIENDIEQKEAALRVGLADSAHPTTESLNLEHETIAEQAAEIIRLHEQVKTLQAAQAIAQKRAAIAALLVEHGLPPLPVGQAPPDTARANAIVSDSFIHELLKAPDEATMRKLVQERAQLVEQARRWNGDAGVGWAERSEAHAQVSRPLSREQTLVETRGENSLAAFVKAIRT
jgi:hypothetical protein